MGPENDIQQMNLQQNNIQMPKPKKKLPVALIIAVSVAVVALGLGIFFYVTNRSEISALKTDVSEKDETIAKLQNNLSSNNQEVNSDVNLSTNNYIYVGQWGIKIKISEDIAGISYTYYNDGNLEIWATKKGTQYAPEYANPHSNSSSPMAILHQVNGMDESEGRYNGGGDININGHTYIYVHPQAVFSVDQDEINDETEVVNMLKEMLLNPENYSEI